MKKLALSAGRMIVLFTCLHIEDWGGEAKEGGTLTRDDHCTIEGRLLPIVEGSVVETPKETLWGRGVIGAAVDRL